MRFFREFSAPLACGLHHQLPRFFWNLYEAFIGFLLRYRLPTDKNHSWKLSTGYQDSRTTDGSPTAGRLRPIFWFASGSGFSTDSEKHSVIDIQDLAVFNPDFHVIRLNESYLPPRRLGVIFSTFETSFLAAH